MIKMKSRIAIASIFLFAFWGQTQAQSVKWVTASDLNKFINENPNSDTTYVINFWATWCKPCLEELPVFEEIHKTYNKKEVKVILVSNDFKKQLNAKLLPYIEAKCLQSEVWWVNEPDPNTWVNFVNPDWSGALPGTLVINNKKEVRIFKEGVVNKEEINQLIKNIQLKENNSLTD